jgi:hypothetical protein
MSKSTSKRNKNALFGVEETQLARVANEGSVGWGSFGALVGRIGGGYGGTAIAMKILQSDAPLFTQEEVDAYNAGELTPEELDEMHGRIRSVIWTVIAGNVIGGSAVAAAGAALGAPADVRGKAALAAAVGGLVPIFGGPIAALATYLAIRPKRQGNPMSTGAKIGTGVAAVAALGGLTYAGIKIHKAKTEEELTSFTQY